jgi:5-methyltetrahydrofolate--homocysteine methyltransferase
VKRHLLAHDDDGILEVAREQAEAGAHVLDVCVALPERTDEADRMARIVTLLSSHTHLPLMIDSTDPAVIERALVRLPRRGLVNSVSLARGRGTLDAIVPVARRHGAWLVALCIDEQGMAVTCARKLEVARRIYDLVVGEHGLALDALIIDPLAFTLATGDPARAGSVPALLESISRLKEAWPGVLTGAGISNVSYGLAGRARNRLNSAFLHHAVAAGLDVAILNPASITPYADIPADERGLVDDLLLNRREDALRRVVSHFGGSPVL